MTKFLHKINTHESYSNNVNKDHQFNITLCEDEYHLHYDKWIDPYNGHDYVEIGGIKWATMNVGANSITDTGLYFQWGDTQGYTADQVGSGEGKKYFGWADYKYGSSSPFSKYDTDGKTILDASDDAVQATWGGNWRMPTTDEFQALRIETTSSWVSDYEGSGVAGKVLTSKADSSIKLFFPAVGFCDSGSVSNVGGSGLYWSSSLCTSGVRFAFYLSVYNSGADWSSLNGRYYGCSVRGVAD